MKQLFKGQISCKAVFSKQARDSYYHGILAATEIHRNYENVKQCIGILFSMTISTTMFLKLNKNVLPSRQRPERFPLKNLDSMGSENRLICWSTLWHKDWAISFGGEQFARDFDPKIWANQIILHLTSIWSGA